MKIEDQNAKTGYIKCKPVSPMIGKNYFYQYSQERENRKNGLHRHVIWKACPHPNNNGLSLKFYRRCLVERNMISLKKKYN